MMHGRKNIKNHRTNSFVMFVEDANILGKIKKTQFILVIL